MLRSLTCPAGAPTEGAFQESGRGNSSWQDTVRVLLPCGVRLLACELQCRAIWPETQRLHCVAGLSSAGGVAPVGAEL